MFLPQSHFKINLAAMLVVYKTSEGRARHLTSSGNLEPSEAICCIMGSRHSWLTSSAVELSTPHTKYGSSKGPISDGWSSTSTGGRYGSSTHGSSEGTNKAPCNADASEASYRRAGCSGWPIASYCHESWYRSYIPPSSQTKEIVPTKAHLYPNCCPQDKVKEHRPYEFPIAM